MSERRRSESKIGVVRPLQERNFNLPQKYDSGSYHLDDQLTKDKQQIRSLRLKCGKINQIERYATILLESTEKLKAEKQGLIRQNALLKQENQNLHLQLRQNAGQFNNMVTKLQKTQRIENQKLFYKLKLEKDQRNHEQSGRQLEIVTLRQELMSEKELHHRAINTLDSKHRSQLLKLNQQIKASSKVSETEITHLKKQSDQLASQNKHLRGKQIESKNQVHSLSLQNERYSLECKKMKSVIEDRQRDLLDKQQKMSKLQNQSYQLVVTLKKQIQELRSQNQKLLINFKMQEKLCTQLKNQGGIMILEAQQYRTKMNNMEEIYHKNLRVIDKLSEQLGHQRYKIGVLEEKNMREEQNNSQMIAMLDRDNIQMRHTVESLGLEIETKRKQIQDLIIIVNRLEVSSKQFHDKCIILEQQNSKLRYKIEEIVSGADVMNVQKRNLLQKLGNLQFQRQELERSLQKQKEEGNKMHQSLKELERYIETNTISKIQHQKKLQSLDLQFGQERKLLEEKCAKEKENLMRKYQDILVMRKIEFQQKIKNMERQVTFLLQQKIEGRL